MRGYYYDQTGEAPRSTPAPISAGRRRRWSGAAAVLLFLLTMALLGGLTAAAGLWSHSRLEELPALADSTWQPLPGREELPEGFEAAAFDYVKLGGWVEALGPLTAPTTNQRLYRIEPDGTMEDITKLFRRKP